jgi:hypothetical protein
MTGPVRWLDLRAGPLLCLGIAYGEQGRARFGVSAVV